MTEEELINMLKHIKIHINKWTNTPEVKTNHPFMLKNLIEAYESYKQYFTEDGDGMFTPKTDGKKITSDMLVEFGVLCYALIGFFESHMK